ncbi:molybdopterin molybdotransferase [Arthrobacter globiformis]|uniref:molybdopterin molybdotransferase MoeA n=1 Tax=Arthrobacter globiformis TaxID=1665 RepID=UPI002787C6EA|nr:molybdopterin molybdotransferase MoeA [Arthrobacter globiformis]MDQ1060542.1 molybdopterin molybdotransferase [Arthrobacter globiformis]
MVAPALQSVDRPGKDGGRPPNREHTWAEARRLAFDSASPLGPEGVPLGEANGRTLAADVVALQEMPHYASSAMDGWTVSGDGPWVLTEPGHPLHSGEASPVVTGGVIPPGTLAVLRVESGRLATNASGQAMLRLGEAASPGEPRPGQHIRESGEEAAAGEVLIPAGTTLNPAHIALAAVAGFDQLTVRGKPLVKMLVTGSEVVAARLPAPGQVRDAFGPQLSTVIQMLGGVPGPLVRIGDSYEEWLTALGASEAPMGQWPDVIVTTGGTGRSGADHFRNAVVALGGRLLIDGIAMRPGHPAALGKLPNGRFVVGLPGNPLAALMALFTVGGPLLAALGHQPLPGISRVPCGSTIDAHRASTRLLPFRWANGLATPAHYTGPGMMRGLASADGVMVVPSRGVQLGEPVPAFALPWRPELRPPLPGKLIWED